MRFQKTVALCMCAPLAVAQQVAIAPVRPQAPVFWRPYLPAEVPPVRLSNSNRLDGLIRAGKLYLTAQDAVALVLENNIDVEVARYAPLSLEWRLERSQAGGALPGVTSSASQVSSVASGQGVLGSQSAAGVSSGAANGANRGPANATVTQVGPVTANLDPSIQEASTFSHRTIPQPLVVQSQTPVLVQGQHVYTGAYQQGFLTGGGFTVSYNDHYLNENSPSDVLNPSVAPALSVSLQHNLLRGRGIAVNARNITVAKANLAMSDLNFKTQVSNTVANVLNTYYALTAAYDDLNAKNDLVAVALRFYEEGKQRLNLGVIAPLDLTSAENQIAIERQILVNSQVTLAQREMELKNLMSRTGLGDPRLTDVRVIPLDHITVPSTDDLPPIRELVRRAVANRTDLLAAQESIKNSEISALGTTNGLLPSLQAFATQNNSGLAGTPRVVRGRTADEYFDGGIGTALGQIFRHNFPSENIGLSGSVVTHNRQAQGDYGIDQLQLRQQQLSNAKDLNQTQVDITNAVVAIRQARARYEAAARARTLQEQLTDAEQKRFNLGASTAFNVVLQQRDLNTAQASEIAAIATYQSARLNLERTTGMTLETNQISLAEAKSGSVARTSALPAVLPN